MKDRIILYCGDKVIKALRCDVQVWLKDLWPIDLPICEQKFEIFTAFVNFGMFFKISLGVEIA